MFHDADITRPQTAETWMASTIEQITNNSGTGYCKMPDGTLIQWGNTTVSATPNADTNVDVTFPVAFVDTSYNLSCEIVGYYRSYAGSYYDYWVINRTTTKGTLRICNSGTLTPSIPLSWLAIGRWK